MKEVRLHFFKRDLIRAHPGFPDRPLITLVELGLFTKRRRRSTGVLVRIRSNKRYRNYMTGVRVVGNLVLAETEKE